MNSKGIELADSIAPQQTSQVHPVPQQDDLEKASASNLNSEPSRLATPDSLSSSDTHSRRDDTEKDLTKAQSNWLKNWRSRFKTALMRFAHLIVGENPQNLDFFARSNEAEEMDEVPDEEIQLFGRITGAILKLFIVVMLTEIFIYRAMLTKDILSVVLYPDEVPKFGTKPPTPLELREMTAMISLYWVIYLIMTSLFIASLKFDKPILIQAVIVIMYLQNFLRYLNFEHRHLYRDAYSLRMLQNSVNMLAIFIAFMIFMTLKNQYHYPFIIIAGFSTSLGSLVFESGQRVTAAIITDNWTVYLGFSLNNVVGNLIIRALFLFIKRQFLNFLKVKVGLHKEIMAIIENLEVALITRNNGRLGFCNFLGFQMLTSIWRDLGAGGSELDLSQRQNILQMSSWIKASSGDDKKAERQVLRAKVFRLYKQHQEGEALDPALREESAYSMDDIFRLSSEQLKDMVFCTSKKYHDQDELGKDIFSSPRREYRLSPKDELKYIQIKKQTFESKNGDSVNDVLQIVDISDQILFNKATAEKKLQALINATVSHEMRNPINSIHCQSETMKQLSSRLAELTESIKPQKEEKKLKKKLDKISIELESSLAISESSTNLLRFLVSDILDFDSIKSSKFRQSISSFNYQEAIAEMVSILKQKAEHKGLSIMLEVPKVLTGAIGEGEALVVCTDKQRLQQVVLNLLSNAIKFTPSGKAITIRVKKIEDVEGVAFGDFVGNRQASLEEIEAIVLAANSGCLQISISDQGIGISGEDQDKLFQLFGFIDEREGLNPQGIGLGLHISKKIIQELGGDIVCISEKGSGASFVVLLPLKQMPDSGVSKHQRFKNPNQVASQKIKLREFRPQSFARELQNGHSRAFLSSRISRDRPKFSRSRGESARLSSEVNALLSENVANGDGSRPKSVQAPLDPLRFQIAADQGYQDMQAPRGEPASSYRSMKPKKGLEREQESESSPRRAPADPFFLNQEGEVNSDRKKEAQENKSLSSALTPINRLTSTLPSKAQEFIKTKRILIVDDEPYNLIGSTILITSAASQLFGRRFGSSLKSLIDEASSGQEAIDQVKKVAMLPSASTYGLILMDCSMPGKDGYTATKEIRAFLEVQVGGEQPLILACTGHVGLQYKEKALACGMDEVIAKPIQVEGVKEVLKSLLCDP